MKAFGIMIALGFCGFVQAGRQQQPVDPFSQYENMYRHAIQDNCDIERVKKLLRTPYLKATDIFPGGQSVAYLARTCRDIYILMIQEGADPLYVDVKTGGPYRPITFLTGLTGSLGMAGSPVPNLEFVLGTMVAKDRKRTTEIVNMPTWTVLWFEPPLILAANDPTASDDTCVRIAAALHNFGADPDVQERLGMGDAETLAASHGHTKCADFLARWKEEKHNPQPLVGDDDF
jgi:hypothetical protein